MPASTAPLLQVKDLVHEFRTTSGPITGTVHAVSGVSFDVWPGETLGVVGETGSGTSTLARSILQAPRPTSGEVVFRGADLVTLRGARLLQAQVSDRVAVMYLGKLCEVGPGDAVYRRPRHPYTRALLDSVPGSPQARAKKTIHGEPPSPVHPPSGCRFRTRCPRAAPRCADEAPPMRELAEGHFAACHFPLGETP